MALKPDREFNEVTDITNFWHPTNTAEKGGIASVVSQGSGAAIGQNSVDEPNVVDYLTSAISGVAKGVLLQDVNAALSATRDFLNFESGEIRPGDKCTLVKKGFVVTDLILGTPIVGGVAYLGASGNISTTSGLATPVVGRFETTVDANGFARVSIDIT